MDTFLPLLLSILFQRKERHSSEQAEESMASKDPGAQYGEVEHVSKTDAVTYTFIICFCSTDHHFTD